QAWNDTARDYDLGTGLPALIAAQARRTPENISAECAGEALDYATLERRTHALSLALAPRGIGRGYLVGVYVPRSLDMLVAVLGTLKSGAAMCRWTRNFRRSGSATWTGMPTCVTCW